jgi:glycosyltransferase involved in cell wall biosynthesis
MKLSIVIPAYNEEKRIGKTLTAFSEFFNSLLKKKELNDYQILVVINGTRDKTEEVVKKYQKKNRKINYLNLKRGGKGFAITSGFQLSLKRNYDIIGFVDADLATPPEQYWRLVKNLGNYDGAIADRYLPESRINPSHNFRRMVVSRVYNLLVRALFGINYRDTQCGAKLIRKEALKKIFPKLILTNWAYDLNMLHLCSKYNIKIKPVPTIWYEIGGGNLRVIKTSIQMFFALIQLRILKSPFKDSLRIITPITEFIYKTIK